MSSLFIADTLSDGEKSSSLYAKLMSPYHGRRYNLPLFIVNAKLVEPKKLHNYEMSDVKDLQFIAAGDGAAALYGRKGMEYT